MHDIADNVSSPFSPLPPSSYYSDHHHHRPSPLRRSSNHNRRRHPHAQPSAHPIGTILNSLPGTIRTRRDATRRKNIDNDDDEGGGDYDERVYSSGRWQWSLKRQQLADGQRIQSRLMIGPGDEPWTNGSNSTTAAGGGIDVARLSHFVDSALTHTRIASSSSSSSSSSGSTGSNTNHSSKVPIPW